MVSLADLLPLALLQRPLGGPQFGSWLPKSQGNVTAGSPSAPRIPEADWAGLMNAFTNMGQAGQQNELREAQAQKLKTEQEMLRLDMELARHVFGGGDAFGTLAPSLPRDGMQLPSGMGLAPAASTPAAPVAAPDMGGGMSAGGALRGSALLQSLLQKASAVALPAGYQAVVTSAERPGARVAGTGGVSQHAHGNAIDIQIVGPDGPIPNTGEDKTGLYSKLAVAMRQVAPAELAGKLAWGGNFTTGPANGPRDLMHFDLGGDRGRFGTLAQLAQSRGAGAPAGGSLPSGASVAAPASPGVPGPPGGVPGGINPQAAQALALLRSARGATVPDFINRAGGLPFVGAEAQAKKEVDLRYAAPLKQAEVSVTEPSQMRLKTHEANETLRQRLAEQGRMLGPGGVVVPIPGYNDTMAATEGAKARAVESATPTSTQKDYQAYVADQQSRGQEVKSFEEWDILRRRSAATNVEQRVEGQGQAALVNAGIKAIDEAHKAEIAANKRSQIYGQMAEAMQGFTPGATAELRLRAYSLLKDIGISAGDDVPPAELFRQAGRRLAIAAAPQGQGAVSNYERELYAQAVPSMVDSPESLAKAIDIGRRLDDYDRAVAQIHRDVAKENRGLPNYVEAQQRIAALGPPLSPGEMAALDRLRQGGGAAPGGPITTPYGTIQEVR